MKLYAEFAAWIIDKPIFEKEKIYNANCRAAVSDGISFTRFGYFAGAHKRNDAFERGDQGSRRVTADLSESGVHDFRPLRRFPHYERVFAEARRFFLYPAAVADDEIAALHEMYKIDVAEGVDEQYTTIVAQYFYGWLKYRRVGMHGIGDVDIRMRFHKASKRLEDGAHRLAPGFAPVHRE